VLPALFRRTIDAGNLLLGTGESRAHLNDLQARGVLAASRHADGALRFEQCAAYESTPTSGLETLR